MISFNPGEDITTWLKTGIEFTEGKLFVVSVASSQWYDCAMVPLGKEKGGKVTIQVERQVKELNSLWIYIVDEETGKKTEIRQMISWFTQDQKISKETLSISQGLCSKADGSSRRGKRT